MRHGGGTGAQGLEGIREFPVHVHIGRGDEVRRRKDKYYIFGRNIANHGQAPCSIHRERHPGEARH